MTMTCEIGEIQHEMGEEAQINLQRYNSGEINELTNLQMLILDAITHPNNPYRVEPSTDVVLDEWNQWSVKPSIAIFSPTEAPDILDWETSKNQWLKESGTK